MRGEIWKTEKGGENSCREILREFVYRIEFLLHPSGVYFNILRNRDEVYVFSLYMGNLVQVMFAL